MTSLFDVIAADENDERLAFRKAAVVTQARVENVYGAWLRQDPSRISAVEDEIRAIAAQAAEEFGVENVRTIADVVLGAGWKKEDEIDEKTSSDLTEEQLTCKSCGGRTSGGHCSKCDGPAKEASVHESRRPKMCPFHKDVVEISLNSGDPSAGYTAMSQHWGGDRHCEGGGYEGGKCNFKPQMTTQAFWDQKAEKAEERRQQREQQDAEAVGLAPVTEEIVEEPIAEVIDNVGDETIVEEVSTEPSAVGEGYEHAEPLAVAAKVAGDEPVDETPDCDKCGSRLRIDGSCEHCDSDGKASSVKTADDGLGGKGTPSPKIDKRLWTPKTVPQLTGLDESSPNPSRSIDPTEAIEYEKTDKDSELVHIDGGNTKVEKLPTSDNAGFSGDGVTGPHTDTWSNNDGQTQPVTAAAEDPDTNPIVSIVEDFISEDEVAKAISDHKE